MFDTPVGEKNEKLISYIIGATSLAIAFFLSLLLIILVARYNPASATNDIFYSIVLGVITPFLVFFAVIGTRAIMAPILDEKELLSVNGWRNLAIALLVVAATGFILGHWIALILPVSMSFLCMSKDARLHKTNQYLKIVKVKLFNSPIYIHWSILLVMAIIFLSGYKDPIQSIIIVLSYFSILLLHEYGHGYVVKRIGYEVIETRFSFLHGLCVYEDPHNEMHNIKIAWGGVLAQLMVAIPLIILSRFKITYDIPYFGVISNILGNINLMIAIFNMAPIRGLDGYTAWKIVPVIHRNWRNRSLRIKKKHNVSK